MNSGAKIVIVVGLVLVYVYYTQPQALAQIDQAGGIDLGGALGAYSGGAQTSSGSYGYSYSNGGGSDVGSYYQPAQGGTQDGVPVGDPGGDVDTLARVIYGEARGESAQGQQGVASVVLNRTRAIGASFGQLGGISGVCTKPLQFTCMSAQYGGSNYTATMSVQAGDPTFDGCLTLAQQAVAGNLPDDTGGATYYHDTSIATPQSWLSAGFTETVQIGSLVFFSSPSVALA